MIDKSLSDSRHARTSTVIDNSLLMIIANVLYLLIRTCLPPIILKNISLEVYGIWSCCFVLIGYIGVGTIGMANTYIKYVAEYRASNQIDKINQLLSTGFAITFISNIVIFCAVWYFLPYFVHLFKISNSLSGTAYKVYLWTLIIFFLHMNFNCFCSVLAGIQEFKHVVGIELASTTLESLLVILLLQIGWGVYSLVSAYAVRIMIQYTFYVIACKKFIPALAVGLSFVTKEAAKLVMSYGGIVQITGLLGTLILLEEKTIAGIFLGSSATALYDLGEKFLIMSINIPGAIVSVMMPAISHAYFLGKNDEITTLYLKSSKYINLISGYFMGYFWPFAAPIIICWLGPKPEFRPAISIFAWFCLPYQLHILTGPVSAGLRGVGKPSKEFLFPLSQLILVVITTSAGYLWKGVTFSVINAAVATSMILSSLFYILYNNNLFGVSQIEYLKKVVIPGLIPYFLGFVVMKTLSAWCAWTELSRWNLVGVMAIAWLAYSLLTGLFIIRTALNRKERAILFSQIANTGRAMPASLSHG